MFTLDPINELIDALRAADIRADVDAKALTVPGVWVQPSEFALHTMGATLDTARLVLIVGDKAPARAYPALVDLLNKVNEVVTVRRAAMRSVLMPDGAYLPGLETFVGLSAPIPAPE